MIMRIGRILLLALLLPLIQGCAITTVPIPVLTGRWEIVNTSGNNSNQTPYGPGTFSVYLNADGSSYGYNTFSNSNCVPDVTGHNIVPTWIALGEGRFQMTISIDNLGRAPNLSFVYTGTYNARTPVPGSTSSYIPAIAGTYYPVGDATLCSDATQANPGHFVATYLPTLSEGSASGLLAEADYYNPAAFDSAVNAIINFSSPPVVGQVAGKVLLASNPTFHGVACFATTNGEVGPLTLDSNRSSQEGVIEYMFADGFDPAGNPTTLFLDSFSANFISANTDGNPEAIQVDWNDWVLSAAIGEDDPGAGPDGVANDGTNKTIEVFYTVIGGACDGANGFSGPFQYPSISNQIIGRKRAPSPHH